MPPGPSCTLPRIKLWNELPILTYFPQKIGCAQAAGPAVIDLIMIIEHGDLLIDVPPNRPNPNKLTKDLRNQSSGMTRVPTELKREFMKQKDISGGCSTRSPKGTRQITSVFRIDVSPVMTITTVIGLLISSNRARIVF